MMDSANVPRTDSLWAATTPPGPDLPELVGTATADVIVIGGGFTGLSTALHLREALTHRGSREQLCLAPPGEITAGNRVQQRLSGPRRAMKPRTGGEGLH
jgi:hypothetical protein